MFSIGLSSMTRLSYYSIVRHFYDTVYASWYTHCFPPSVSAQQTPHQSLKVVGVRSWVWSWVTICIKSLTTDTVWTCAASVSDQERTAGFCTWTCWWAVTLQHFIKMARHVRIYTLSIPRHLANEKTPGRNGDCWGFSDRPDLWWEIDVPLKVGFIFVHM